jgi:DNA-binding NarL/FixJ family response regulator
LRTSSTHVLVVDDYEPWRRFAATMLRKRPGCRIIGEASDGLEAVRLAEQLHPHLILLDVGLPRLNGIEAARQIRDLSPHSKVLFMSEHHSWDITKEAVRSGACGFVLKSDGSELLLAMDAVLSGKQFVSSSLTADFLAHLVDASNDQYPKALRPIPSLSTKTPPHHEVVFYSEDQYLLDKATGFIAEAIRAGNVAIVVATASHREGLLSKMESCGLDMSAAMEQGRYVAVDAADTISTFFVNDEFDRLRLMDAFGDLVGTAAKAANKVISRPRLKTRMSAINWLGCMTWILCVRTL